MGKYDVSIYKEVNVDTDIEEVFNELTVSQREEFFKENLEDVLSIDEALKCYDSEKLERYIIDNWSKEDVEELLGEY